MSLSVTPSAVEAIAQQLAKRGTPSSFLRVGVKGGGCSGFSYVVQFEDDPPTDRDVVQDLVSNGGSQVRVIVDRKSLLYLDGATLDHERTLMREGFSFRNPNEKSSCGCGVSFSA